MRESCAELAKALAGLPQDAILDGEIVAWEYPAELDQTQEVVDGPITDAGESKAMNPGRARPFSTLQQRLGRKKVSAKMLRDAPVAYLAFDVLYAGGELLIDRPLEERAAILDELLAGRTGIYHGATESRRKSETAEVQGNLSFELETQVEEVKAGSVIRAPVFRTSSPEQLEELFTAAQSRGNEGLMIKDLTSPYTPGKRGKSWLKMKRELATLDVVVTAGEYGHGKRN